MHVAVLTVLGRKLADKEFRTDAGGYSEAIRFMTGHGGVQSVGVEGTSSYGAGLTKALITAGIAVIEVNRPDRALPCGRPSSPGWSVGSTETTPWPTGTESG